MDMRKAEAKKLLTRVRERYRIMYEADKENRDFAIEDMRFVNVPGEMWDDNMKQQRGQRPCYEFNKIRPTSKRVINDMRANRPHAKIRAVEGGDKEVAEINEGLIRNIWNTSDAETVTDYAAEYQVNAGMGCWRVDTEYSDDTAFEQDICVKPILNPFCLFADPSCKDLLKRDADDWLLTERVSKESFKAKYPKEDLSDFEVSTYDDDDEWQDEETVRLAEYWYKEPHKKEIWLMHFPVEGGVEEKVVDSESDEGQAIAQSPELMQLVVRRREVMAEKIFSCVVSGSKILEGPTEWAGSMFPFVMVHGEFIVIDGKSYWWGLPRFAKDAQRSYNVSRTSIVETVAGAPKSFFWATPEQAAGLTDQWADAHKKNMPFQLYNPDPRAPGPPTRIGGADVPVALIQEAQMASEDIKSVTGIFDASVGRQGNETSGRAIYARQQQGEIATFNFQDNMSKGVQRTYEIILDLIPEIYDTERELRILGNDGAEDYVRVNQVVQDPRTGQAMRVNDLSSTKYDVTITTGPNFSTQRQEAAETYGQMAQSFPGMMEIAGDLVFKSMDLPYAEDIADRLKMLLPPQVQQMMQQGKEVPPEVQQMMQQAQAAMQQVEEHGQLVQAAMQELEQEQGDAEKKKSEVEKALANLRAAKAEFDADMEKQMAQVALAKAGLTMKDAQIEKKGTELIRRSIETNKELAEMIGATGTLNDVESIPVIDEVLSNFMMAVDAAVGTLRDKTDKRVTGGVARREGGRLVADVQFDDGSERSLTAFREGGELRIAPEDDNSPGGANSRVSDE